MNHPDLEYEILRSIAEEHVRGGHVAGLRQPRGTRSWRLRLLQSSGDKMVALGTWLIAHSDRKQFMPVAPEQARA